MPGFTQSSSLIRATAATSATRTTAPCVHHYFEGQVHRSPDAVAAVYGRDCLTYAELDHRANQFARVLRALGVGPDVLVGLFLPRSLDMLISIFAIWKAGGAYVPLDVMYPPDRLHFMLKDAGAGVVITTTELERHLPSQDVHVLCLDRHRSDSRQQDGDPPHIGSADDLAYVIYTSGSTGTPKGVMVPHQGVVNYLQWCIDAYQVWEGTGTLVHSPLAFDLTVTSLFAPLLVGQRCILVPEGPGIEGLASVLLGSQDLSLVKITPAHLQALIGRIPSEQAAGRVRVFVIGGEALQAETIAFWRQHAPETRLINEYGPTETVVGCCVYGVTKQSVNTGNIPIGRPIANTTLHVLDECLNPVQSGEVGELYIGGRGVARGYHQRPELTSARFVPDPFAVDRGARMYKSGDLVRMLPDGNLEFLGRTDDQVKIRGYRIELGEIEAVLKQHDAVRQVAVVTSEVSHGGKRLLAYVSRYHGDTGDHRAFVQELKTFARSKLAEYMVPAAFCLLADLPLTVNGKIDRKALDGRSPFSKKSDLDIHGILEMQLIDIWEDILGCAVGPEDEFFELGGDSIMAVQMLGRVEDLLGQRLSIETLLHCATVRQLARALREDHTDDSQPMVKIKHGEGTPLFLIHGDVKGGLYCPRLAKQLVGQYDVYMIHPPGFGDLPIFETVEDAAKANIELLRTVQASGPYRLAGYCNGGIVAFEMAQQLQAQGQQVELLLLIAAHGSNARFKWLSVLVKAFAAWRGYSPTQRRQLFLRWRELCFYYRQRWREVSRLKPQELLKLIAQKGSGVLVCISETVRSVDRHAVYTQPHYNSYISGLLANYIPKRYDGRLTIFKPRDEPAPDVTMGWARVAKNLDLVLIPGDHSSCVANHPDAIAKEINSRIVSLSSV